MCWRQIVITLRNWPTRKNSWVFISAIVNNVDVTMLRKFDRCSPNTGTQLDWAPAGFSACIYKHVWRIHVHRFRIVTFMVAMLKNNTCSNWSKDLGITSKSSKTSWLSYGYLLIMSILYYIWNRRSFFWCMVRDAWSVYSSCLCSGCACNHIHSSRCHDAGRARANGR